jgi:hypothetical protein
MPNLAIDQKTSMWLAVHEYVRERINEMAEECLSIQATSERRAELAARAAELRDLLKAPEESRTRTELRTEQPRGTY